VTDLPEIASAKIVRVQPGDVIWLRSDHSLHPDQANQIKQYASTVWPDNKIVVADRIDVALIRSREEPA
jgi:hypothetical protein